VTPLRQIDASAPLPDRRLYRPQPAYRLHFPTDVNRRRPVGDNPPNGAIIDYFLRTKPAAGEQITLEILDAQGKVLRTFSNHNKDKFEQPAEWPDREKPLELLPDEPGMNRFPWDLRTEDPIEIPGAFYADEGPKGPVVIPGSYRVRLTTPHGQESVPLEVVPDPRLKETTTPADMAAHWDLALRTREDIEALHRAVNQIRAIRNDLGTLRRWAASDSAAQPLLLTSADFERKMAPIEEQLIQVNMKASEDNLRYPNRLNEQYDTFSATIDGDDVRPTEPQQQVFAELHRRLSEQLTQWSSLVTTDLPTLNAQMQRAGVPHLTAPAGD